MATGDKIFIADKATLDQVKSNTDAMSTSLGTIQSNTQSIINSTNTIQTNINTNSDRILAAVNQSSTTNRSYYTPADIAAAKYKVGRVQINSSASNNYILNTSGVSGLFYGILLTCSSFNSGQSGADVLEVYLDDTKVYSSTYNHISIEHYGMITKDLLIEGGGSVPPSIYLPGANPVSLYQRMLGSPNTNNAGNTLIYLPKPIRFESSVRIIGYTTNLNNRLTDSYAHYFYEID